MSAGSLLRRAALRAIGPVAVCAAGACIAFGVPATAGATTTTTTTTTDTSAVTTTTTSTMSTTSTTASTTTTTSSSSSSTTTAAKAPTVSTSAATAVSFASATLGGTIDPNGLATEYYVEYGTTNAYGTQTSQASAGSGTSAVARSAGVSGLSPSKTYHFRLVAVSSAGTTDGVDETFTTTATPAPTVSTGGVKSVTSNAAVVTGAIDPHGVPTTYQFQYGRTAAYGSHTATESAGSGTSGVTVSATIGGLAASTGYHYRIVATSAGGVVAGSDHTVTTGKVARASATTGAATQVTPGSTVLTGTVHLNGASAQYDFQYGTSSAYSTHTPVQSLAAGTSSLAVSATITGLAAATRYHYRLFVASGGGTSAGSDHTVTTTDVPLSLVATITPGRTYVNGSATITGNLTGTAAAGRQVMLVATPFPYTAAFAQVGNAEVVAPNGTFSFPVAGLQQNTQFKVVTVGSPSASTGVITEGVVVRVSFGGHATRTRRGVRLTVSGSVQPGASDVVAYLQKLVRRRWVTSTPLDLTVASANVLRYRRTLRIGRGGRYRVLVVVTDGARIGTTSRALTFRRPRR